jgi:predicted dienelactone hydrolase
MVSGVADRGRASLVSRPGVARVVDRELQVAAGTFEAVRSHARIDAAAVVRKGRSYPVVIYSPGFGSWRNATTALTEELVSHGFVVVTIDHPFDAAAVEFPDGTVVKARPLPTPANTKVLTFDAWDAMVKPFLSVRVADVRFVLDVLEALHAGRNPDADRRFLPSHLAGALDLDHIGMFGHSLGGATTAQVMRIDPRIRAGLSLDGPIPKANTAPCIEQPIVLIRSVDPGDRAVDRSELEALSGRRVRLAPRPGAGWLGARRLHRSYRLCAPTRPRSPGARILVARIDRCEGGRRRRAT